MITDHPSFADNQSQRLNPKSFTYIPRDGGDWLYVSYISQSGGVSLTTYIEVVVPQRFLASQKKTNIRDWDDEEEIAML